MKITMQAGIGVVSVWIGVLGSSSYAQTCKLDWAESSTCLNINELNGDTIVLPSNVTRLGGDGLKLCPMASSNAEMPAVLFVLDQSSSMNVAQNGTPVGDPHNFRATAIHNSMEYLYNVSPSSWFGFVEFAGIVDGPLYEQYVEQCKDFEWLNSGVTDLISQEFLPLNAQNVALWADSLQSPIQNRCRSGTNYYAALTRAKEIANNFDPGDVPAEVSIIMISDGRASVQTDSTWEPLETDFRVPGEFPPVYGIFLGAELSGGGTDLASLSSRTGGKYYEVDPSDTAGMSNVMNSIIQLISQFSMPDTVMMTVNGAKYQAVDIREQGAGFEITFPQTVPLSEGFNTVSLEVTYIDSATGLPRTRLSSFTLKTTESAVGEGVYPAGGYFNINCSIRNSLVVNGVTDPSIGGTTIDVVPWISSQDLENLELALTADAYTGGNTQVRVVSARTGDVYYTTLSPGNTGGLFTGSTALAFVGVNAQGLPKAGDSTDLVFQVASFDTLYFQWYNPDDPRDSLTASILLYEPPRLNFPSDSMGIDQITSLLHDVAVNGSRANVEYSWLGGEFIGAGTLSRLDTLWNFRGSQNMQQQLQGQLSNGLVVRYVDPLFQVEYLDTVWLIFDVPVLPIAWMLDEDGDGRAEKLQLVYLQDRPLEQFLPRYRVVWGMVPTDSTDRQDTLYLEVDSLNPRMSFDVVQIQNTSAGEQWTFVFPVPFKKGHTCGTGEQGEGELTVWGSYNGRPIERYIPIVDKVGPVLVQAWVDGKDINKTYLRASEPLGTAEGKDWVFGKRSSGPESQKRSYEMPVVSESGVIGLVLEDDENNRLLGGDSVRFLYASLGGVRDRAGNGAHLENPWVPVRGAREGITQILIAFEEALVRDQLQVPIPQPWQEDVYENEFRVLIPVAGGYKELETGVRVHKDIAKSMPTLGVTVDLPQLHGLDAAGNPREGMIIDGKLAYITTITADVFFYDQVGQFITRKKGEAVIDDTTDIPANGKLHFALTWQADPQIGLLSKSGRAVGTGVLIARTRLTVESVATMDLDIYDENGEISEDSMKTGDVKTKKKQTTSRLGYLHK